MLLQAMHRNWVNTKRGTKFESWISANRPFRDRAKAGQLFSGTLGNVDSAERVTLFVPGTTFLHINGVLACSRRSDHCGDCVKGFEYECLEYASVRGPGLSKLG